MKPTLVLALLAVATPALAQTSPYAAEAPRAITSLADEEVANLLDGAGMGFARAAELNGVPGPRHALDMADELHLDDAQRADLQTLFDEMQAEARRLGASIVESERALDTTFASGRATADDVERRSVAIGQLYGQLRATHLKAHLATIALLSAEQVARYNELRGYTASGHDAAAHEAHAH